MSYLAMARKWRPRNFEEMVGQDHIAQTIRNAIGGQRISHAYLFTGTRGVGKTTSARILAKALNCKKGPTATPCDACENCLSVNAGNSMDVLEIDGASNNSVDNIRDLREQVKYAPMHGTYKIYVIDEVHMLSKSAFNALLKTLEEPPPHVVFIFATTEASKLPHTILSRVQRFDFKRISESRIRERLEYICSQEAIKPERPALEAIARKADGSMRDALSLFDQVYAFSGADLSMEAARKVLGLPREEMFDSLVRALVSHDQKACFDLLQEAHREGIETADLLLAFGEYLRNLLFSQQGVSPAVLGLGDARHAELGALVRELKLRDGDILRFAKIVSDLLGGLRSAANPRLAVELGFARMASLDRVVTLSQLIGGELPSAPSAAPAATAPSMAPGAPGSNGANLSNGTPARPADPAKATESPKPAATAREAAAEEAEPKKKSPAESLTRALAADMAAAESAPPAYPDPAASTEPGAPPEGAGPDSLPALDAEDSFETREPDSQGAQAFTATAVLTAPAPSLAAISSDADPDASEEEYPIDPDDPDMVSMSDLPPGAFPAPAKAVAEEPAMVPVQDGPGLLPALWPQLVTELMISRPFLGSSLRRTRLEWESDGTQAMRLVFLDRAGHSIIADDGDFRKSIQAFLGSKIRGVPDFQFKYHLDEEAAGSGDAAALAASGIDEVMGAEPIVAFIRNLFEGRTVG